MYAISIIRRENGDFKPVFHASSRSQAEHLAAVVARWLRQTERNYECYVRLDHVPNDVDLAEVCDDLCGYIADL